MREVDLSDMVTGMEYDRGIVVGTVFGQVQLHIDITRVGRRVGCKVYKILVETIIAAVHQYICDALALPIELVYSESCTFIYIRGMTGGIGAENFGNGIVVYVIFDRVDIVGFTGMQGVDGREFLAPDLGLQRHVGVHIAHILHGCAQVFHRKVCLGGIKDHGLLADALQGAVDPLAGVASGQRIGAQGYLEEREPFGIGLLVDVGFQYSGIKTFGIRLDLHAFKQIFFIGNVLGSIAASKQCDAENGDVWFN